MKILDKDNNEIMNPDLEKGHLNVEIDKTEETGEILRYTPYTTDQLEQIAKEKEEAKNKETKLNSLYTADITFGDVVDAVAGLLYGGAES